MQLIVLSCIGVISCLNFCRPGANGIKMSVFAICSMKTHTILCMYFSARQSNSESSNMHYYNARAGILVVVLIRVLKVGRKKPDAFNRGRIPTDQKAKLGTSRILCFSF